MERFSLVIKDPRLRLRAMYVAIFALGVFFSVLIVAYSQQVLESTHRLVRVDLPLLDRIADLKVELSRQEATLYDYRATAQRERFERDYPSSTRRSFDLYADIEYLYGNSEPLPSIRLSLTKLDDLARRLQEVPELAPNFDSDTHPILLRVTEVVREIHAELDVLTQLIEARILTRAIERQQVVGRMAQFAILFSIGIFLIAVFVGHYINLYLRTGLELRRLAVFAERNPNPVMRLTPDGQILYANTAAEALVRRMGANSARILLPEDLRERLTALRGPAERYEVWRYDRETHSLECGIHYLSDLDTFHAYIADVTERRLSEEKLIFQAYHHPLTGLPNRRMFEEVVNRTLFAPEQGGVQAAILMIATDRFKVIIDTLGLTVGDQVLQALATRLTIVLEESHGFSHTAVPYHFEGDLFAIFIPGIANNQMPVQIAERLVASSGQPLYVAEREFFLSFSVGIAFFPVDGKSVTELVKNADSAMQAVQRQGGRGLRLYKPEMNAMAVHWLALENHLRHAIERNELRLHYQPQIDVRTGRVVGLEALLRWEHPQWGLLSPKDFIKLAEDSGMIVPIGDWVLRAACMQCRDWRNRNFAPVRVAVNISGRQFHRQNLPQVIEDVLREADLPPETLELEITESVAMEDVERTAAMLRELHVMKVRLAIDDFGTGFSSLAYLKRFPINKLKIDQSFVHHMTVNDADATIARAVVTLGHALKLRVCAEGVATVEQLARLRQYECDDVQGELYSQPLPARDIEAFLRNPESVLYVQK